MHFLIYLAKKNQHNIILISQQSVPRELLFFCLLKQVKTLVYKCNS